MCETNRANRSNIPPGPSPPPRLSSAQCSPPPRSSHLSPRARKSAGHQRARCTGHRPIPPHHPAGSPGCSSQPGCPGAPAQPPPSNPRPPPPAAAPTTSWATSQLSEIREGRRSQHAMLETTVGELIAPQHLSGLHSRWFRRRRLEPPPCRRVRERRGAALPVAGSHRGLRAPRATRAPRAPAAGMLVGRRRQHGGGDAEGRHVAHPRRLSKICCCCMCHLRWCPLVAAELRYGKASSAHLRHHTLVSIRPIESCRGVPPPPPHAVT